MAIDGAGEQIGVFQVDPCRAGPSRLALSQLDDAAGRYTDLASERLADAADDASDDREIYRRHRTVGRLSRLGRHWQAR
jgi:hypothetical protein